MTTYLPFLGEMAGLIVASLVLAYLTRRQTPSESSFEQAFRQRSHKARKPAKWKHTEPLPHSLSSQSGGERESTG